MSSRWLDIRPPEAMRYWLQHSATPFVAKKPDGTILWANEAFEKLVGYTLYELLQSDKLTWKKLTASREDVAAGEAMLEDLVAGVRIDYQLQKEYVAKNGQPSRVCVHVLRYPLQGEFEFLLVSITPLDLGHRQTLDEISRMRVEMLTALQAVAQSQNTSTMRQLLDWAKSHPTWAAVLGFVLLYLIAGTKAIEVLAEAKKLIFGP